MKLTARVGLMGLYLFAGFSSFSQIQPAFKEPKSRAIAAYQKIVFDAIGQHWYELVDRNVDVITLGTIRVSFSIRPDGHVEKIRTFSNTSNQAFERVAYQAIQQARIPPISASALKDLPGRRMDLEVSFETFPNR